MTVKCPVWNCKEMLDMGEESSFWHISSHKHMDLVTTLIMDQKVEREK